MFRFDVQILDTLVILPELSHNNHHEAVIGLCPVQCGISSAEIEVRGCTKSLKKALRER